MLERGNIYRFSYLWSSQDESGEESGRKARPACLVLKTTRRTGNLYLFPITTTPPHSGRLSLEIPPIERKRAGLDRDCWIVLDEYNVTSEKSAYDFQSLDPIGRFSEAFLREMALVVKRAILSGRMKAIRRT